MELAHAVAPMHRETLLGSLLAAGRLALRRGSSPRARHMARHGDVVSVSAESG